MPKPPFLRHVPHESSATGDKISPSLRRFQISFPAMVPLGTPNISLSLLVFFPQSPLLETIHHARPDFEAEVGFLPQNDLLFMGIYNLFSYIFSQNGIITLSANAYLAVALMTTPFIRLLFEHHGDSLAAIRSLLRVCAAVPRRSTKIGRPSVSYLPSAPGGIRATACCPRRGYPRSIRNQTYSSAAANPVGFARGALSVSVSALKIYAQVSTSGQAIFRSDLEPRSMMFPR